jgi:hypothetical protein
VIELKIIDYGGVKMKKVKVLTKKQLAQEIENMQYGDVLSLEFYKGTAEDFAMIYVPFAKTKWMDSNAYILGGCNDEIKTFPVEAFDEKWDIYKLSGEQLVENIYNNYNFDDTVKVAISHKYQVTIHIKGDRLLGNVKYGERYDNRVYER